MLKLHLICVVMRGGDATKGGKFVLDEFEGLSTKFLRIGRRMS